MIDNPALRKLAMRVLRAEIDARRPLDGDVIERLIEPQLVVDAAGDIIVTDEAGVVRIGRGPGFTAMSPGELLDELIRTKPALFQASHAPGRPAVETTDNPFMPGAGHSVTRQMVLMNTDPELAERLAAEAGTPVRTIR